MNFYYSKLLFFFSCGRWKWFLRYPIIVTNWRLVRPMMVIILWKGPDQHCLMKFMMSWSKIIYRWCISEKQRENFGESVWGIASNQIFLVVALTFAFHYYIGLFNSKNVNFLNEKACTATINFETNYRGKTHTHIHTYLAVCSPLITCVVKYSIWFAYTRTQSSGRTAT